MAETTPILGLTKSGYSDTADIDAYNDNMDKIDAVAKYIYPVGSIYMSVDSTNPGTLFPGTTWQQLKDRFLLGAGDTYVAGTTGGAASRSYTPAGSNAAVTLTINQIPSHTHGMNSHTHGAGTYKAANAGSHNHQMGGWVGTAYGEPYKVNWLEAGQDRKSYTDAAGEHSHNITGTSGAASGDTAAKGGGQSHNHTFTGTAATIQTMPPYLTVYMWKRTA